jgi:predicted O-methyltransferase YrrM
VKFHLRAINHARSLAYLFRSGVTAGALRAYVATLVLQWTHSSEITETTRQAQLAFVKTGRFTTDWFSEKVWFWEKTIAEQGLDRPRLQVLEIGSWEGRSTCYMLDRLPGCTLMAVDTWQGSEENITDKGLNFIEKKFSANTRRFKGRVKKRKGTSLDFFHAWSSKYPERSLKGYFDLIYVDGSHRADDVLCDTIQAFALLKPGGVMVLDDYLWRFYPQIRRNPAAAIHSFLRLKRDELQLLYVANQVYLKKLGA